MTESDDTIKHNLFEEFSIDVISFLHEDTLNLFLDEGMIDDDILEKSIVLRNSFMQLENRVKDGVELICPAGPIGPQIDLGVDMYLPGNSSLTQYDLFNGLGRKNRTDFIEVVPGSIKRIK